jgi:hypothetical protein
MSYGLKNIDFDSLVAFCQSNLAAKVLMESLACRQKNCWAPTVDALWRITKSRGYNFAKAEIRKCCHGLEKANCGNLKRAYGERKSQFEWGYSPIQIAKEVVQRLNIKH